MDSDTDLCPADKATRTLGTAWRLAGTVAVTWVLWSYIADIINVDFNGLYLIIVGPILFFICLTVSEYRRSKSIQKF